MLGKTIKSIRQRKAWSQAHLAEAAGVSIRTVQRLERSGQCSGETLMAVASALDVDVQHLTRIEPAPTRSLLPEIQPRQAMRWGALLSAPSVTFILANVLKYELGLPQLYDLLARLGSAIGLASSSLLLSPVLLIGGPALAVLLNLLALFRIRGERKEDGVSILGLDFAPDSRNLLMLIGALLCLAVLLGYATMENLSEWVLELTKS